MSKSTKLYWSTRAKEKNSGLPVKASMRSHTWGIMDILILSASSLKFLELFSDLLPCAVKWPCNCDVFEEKSSPPLNPQNLHNQNKFAVKCFR